LVGTLAKTFLLRPAYSFFSMLAEIGGYFGLFLGVSVANLAELLVNKLDRKRE